jgi:bifunctional DNase/RNase
MGVDAGMVVLTEDDYPFRSLRIIIGPTEAGGILAGWHGAVPGRPSTWDLFISTVAILGGRIDRVVITAVQEERHYFAHIEIEQGGDRRILACRPSDAIALAVRSYQAAILAEAEVLDAAGVLPDGTKPGKVESAEAGDASASLAEREAALAAREAALAARERALAEAAAGTGSLTGEATQQPPATVAVPGEPGGAREAGEPGAAPELAAAGEQGVQAVGEAAPAGEQPRVDKNERAEATAPPEEHAAGKEPASEPSAEPARHEAPGPSSPDTGATGPATGLPVTPG